MVQKRKSFLKLSKSICKSQVPEVQIESRFKICQSLVVQIVSRFKVSQSLAIEVQSWKSRFKICQSQELVVQEKNIFKTVKI